MRKGDYLAILTSLIVSIAALTIPAFSALESASAPGISAIENTQTDAENQATLNQARAVLTLYVLDGSVNGSLLSGVTVTAYDAGGSIFKGATDAAGSMVIQGQPGTWQFSFEKVGYETLSQAYEVDATETAYAHLQPATGDQNQDYVTLTAFVHEGDLNGQVLSGVSVTGEDAAGNGFEGTTNASGSVILQGMPGAWQFSFAKEGYEPLSLSYNVTKTHEAAAYLQTTAA
jgi:hypothetical protein